MNQALSLAKDCYIIKNNLLGDKTAIERAVEFVHSYYEMKQLEVQNEIDNSRYTTRGRVFAAEATEQDDPLSNAKF